MSCTDHKHCLHTALENAEAYCESHGLRFTEHRRRVFEILWQSHRALTAADIMTKLGNSQPPITYRALDFLTQHGLVHHVASMGAYVGCNHPHAHGLHMGQLLICESCHDVQELEQEKPSLDLTLAAKAQGFRVSHGHIELLGRCANCQ